MRKIIVTAGILLPSLAAVSVAQAEEGQISGFMDTVYMLSDGTNDPADSPLAQKWGVTSEFDYKLNLARDVKLRIDMDLSLADNNGAGETDSAKMEQAFISWQTSNALRVTGGVFNNPLGWEAEDAPDMFQISHGQIYNIFDGITIDDGINPPQTYGTALWGNNVAGIAVSGVVGPVVITGGMLNDLGNAAEKTSFAVVVNGNIMKELEIEGGMLTEDGGYERLIDVNATYKDALFTVGGEILLASAIVDTAIGITGNYAISDQLSATLRYDTVSYEGNGVDNTSTITMAVGYLLEKNLGVNFEIKLQNDPNDPDDAAQPNNRGIIGDGDMIALEFVASF